MVKVRLLVDRGTCLGTFPRRPRNLDFVTADEVFGLEDCSRPMGTVSIRMILISQALFLAWKYLGSASGGF